MRKRDVISVVASVLLMIAVLVLTAAADTHRYVDARNGYNSNDGKAPGFGHAWKTITHAISATAGLGSQGNPLIIHVAPGTYATFMGSGDHEGFPLVIDSHQKYLTIQGEGIITDVIVSADNVSTAFNIEYTDHITLQYFTVKNGHTDAYGNLGGGIFWTDSHDLTIQHCQVMSSVGYLGGGIHVSTTVTNILIDDCDVHDNQSSNGNGGGICCMSPTTVSNCRIYGNSVSASAGSKQGGGIYCENSTVKDCKIHNNTAKTGAGLSYGGAGTVENCEFWGNEATAGGGGMLYTGRVSAHITNCTFNSPGHESPNKASSGAGLLSYQDSNPVITDCTFYRNEATFGGGGICCSGRLANLAMTRGGITENKAPYGGGIYCGPTADPTFDTVTISGNQATAGDGGGAYIYDDSRPSFVDCTISGNKSLTGDGGGVCIDKNCVPSFTGGSITQNEALSGDGGGVHCIDGSSPIFRKTSITSNEAQNGAGARLDGGGWDFDDGELIGNTASQSGGGVYASGGSTVGLAGNVISTNKALAGNGGGIYSAQSSLTLTSNAISTNEASNYGGGLCASDNSTLTLDGFDWISKNKAANGGGGIYYEGSSGGIAFNAVINENEATSHPGMGGGALCDTSASPEFLCCTIYHNLSSGVVATGGATPTLTNCILWANTVDVSGIACSKISHCDIEDGSCNGQNSNFSADPRFVKFYEGEAEEEQTFYLSQTAAGQAEDSPCIDSGDDQASAYGLDVYTTASDGRRDKEEVDIGAHYADRYSGKLYYVDATDGNDTNDGSEANPWRTITHALSEVDGESLKPKTIIVESGTYSASMNPTQHESFPLEMEEFVALEAATTDSDAKTIDAEGNHRVININVDHVAIDGFTIQNGDANDETNTEGGGIRLENAGRGTILTNNVIKNSTATQGGGIYCVSSLPWIESCTFSGNSADNGAGISLESASSPDLLRNTFSSNTASDQGGGIYIGAGCYPAITYCTVSPNNAAVRGGGIYVPSNWSVPIENCTVSQNVASAEGGGIYMGSNCSPPITNCTISYNQGGGLYMGDDCSPAISDCTIQQNTESAQGGGIRMGDRCSPSIDSSSISSNTSTGEGGGIYMPANCSPSIADSAIDSNTASTKGGALYVGADSTPTLTDCSMNTNACDAAGGAVAFVGSGNAQIASCELMVNSAGTDGGAILCESGTTPNIADCTIKYNDADRDGGAIACFSSSEPTFENNLLRYNTCSQYGGAIFCTGGSASRFEAGHKMQWNEAGEAGGAIYCSDSASPYVFCALIQENTVTSLRGVGAAIACYSSSSPEFLNCTIEGNRKGGVFATGGAAPTLTNCIISNNDGDLAGVGCSLITHCCIEDGDCEGQSGNIAGDPLLVPLPMTPCYLSHKDAGQSDTSPCIDAGLGQSSDYGLDQYTTRTDGELDQGTVDMGFHYEFGLNSFYVDCKNGDDSSSGRKGYPWKTITHAVVQEGLGTEESPAFIQVAPGLYDYYSNHEDFPFEPHAWTMLLGAGAKDDENTGSIIDGTDIFEPFLFSTYGDGGYASVGNFWIKRGGDYAIWCEDSVSVVIHDCVITDTVAKGNGTVYLKTTIDTRLLRCKITGNSDPSHNGAGLMCFYGNPSIEYCEITNNDSMYGGAGVSLSRSPATFLGCTISGNTSGSDGAGVYADGGFTMKDCTISGNTASGSWTRGGGMSISRLNAGDRILINCTISGNKTTGASSCGGGAFLGGRDGPVKASDCVFENNKSVTWGGGIYFEQSSTQTLENCLIVGNSAGAGAGAGSAVYCNATSSAKMINCTVEGNDKTGVDGGTGTGLTLTNCIIWNNGDDIVNVACSQISHCDIKDGDCKSDPKVNLNRDPLFVPRDPADPESKYTGYYLAHLDAQVADSPCLDAGDDSAGHYGMDIFTTCTDGRYDEGTVDIGYHYTGAYEGNDDTYIGLARFEAKASGRSILITWETGTEIDNAGFDLYRVDAGDRTTPRRMNERMVPAKGSPAAGASYEFIDADVRPGVAYSYYLLDIDTDGKTTLHGPVSARVALSNWNPRPPDTTRPVGVGAVLAPPEKQRGAASSTPTWGIQVAS